MNDINLLSNDELVKLALSIIETLRLRALNQNDFRAISSIMKIDEAIRKISG